MVFRRMREKSFFFTAKAVLLGPFSPPGPRESHGMACGANKAGRSRGIRGALKARRANPAGFSLLEMLVTIAVMMVLMSIAIPSVMRAWRAYQLNSAATQVAAVIKATRSEAVRQNKQTSCLIQQDGNGIWWIGEDNGNGTLDPTKPEAALTGSAAFLAAGVAPDPASMGYPAAPQVPGGLISFDARGGVVFGGNPTVFVLYIGLAGDNESGFRAVTVVPAGSTQAWLAPPGAGWVRMS